MRDSQRGQPVWGHAGCKLSNPLYPEVHPGAVKTICLRALRLQRQGSLYRDVHDTNDTRWISFPANHGCWEEDLYLSKQSGTAVFERLCSRNRLRRRFLRDVLSFAWGIRKGKR
ncbi:MULTISPECIES: hypothetical protein [Paenibacillus]|uniref:hypothetical protein n=1 Tax=Paenibacillus TaxID=44249 RepID=UPI0015772D54|nr:hypothetical protein [Paenibacillus sp. JMULE4]NTZ19729.1 hypothetical protein [Paenibacillus sp. JMULE4]